MEKESFPNRVFYMQIYFILVHLSHDRAEFLMLLGDWFCAILAVYLSMKKISKFFFIRL